MSIFANMEETITLRLGCKGDASVVASLIMEAMRPECCQYFYGTEHTSEEFHEMMSTLVERECTQYSYTNTICAVDRMGKVVGILVSYDGGKLLELRQSFIREVFIRFGRDFSNMPNETEKGELYIDSVAVVKDLRGRNIAKHLFNAAAAKAKELDIKSLGLLVDRDNPDAERLYRKLGFKYVNDRDWGGHTLKHMQCDVNDVFH